MPSYDVSYSRPIHQQWIPPGREGTRQTLEVMRQLARQASRLDQVQCLAAAIWTPKNLDLWFRRFWVSVPDPPEAEWITIPEWHLGMLDTRGYMAGDCDDAATLGAAIALAAGWPSQFVAIRHFHEPEFSHVFLRADGIDIDPIVPEADMPIRGFFEIMEMEVV